MHKIRRRSRHGSASGAMVGDGMPKCWVARVSGHAPTRAPARWRSSSRGTATSIRMSCRGLTTQWHRPSTRPRRVPWRPSKG